MNFVRIPLSLSLPTQSHRLIYLMKNKHLVGCPWIQDKSTGGLPAPGLVDLAFAAAAPRQVDKRMRRPPGAGTITCTVHASTGLIVCPWHRHFFAMEVRHEVFLRESVQVTGSWY